MSTGMLTTRAFKDYRRALVSMTTGETNWSVSVGRSAMSMCAVSDLCAKVYVLGIIGNVFIS